MSVASADRASVAVARVALAQVAEHALVGAHRLAVAQQDVLELDRGLDGVDPRLVLVFAVPGNALQGR